MWYKSESSVRPSDIDTTSSQKYNYVRRNVTEEDGRFIYEEAKIDKESWGLYKELQEVKEQNEELSTVLDFLLMGEDM